MFRRAPRIALLTAAAVLAVAGLAVAGVRTGVLPAPAAFSAAKSKQARPIRVKLSPKTVRLTVDRTVRVKVAIDGRRWPNTGGTRARSAASLPRAKVRLSVVRPLPRGVSVRVVPRVTAKRRAVLYVRATSRAATGIHKLRVVATRVRPRGARRQRAIGTLRAVLARPAAPRTTPTGTPVPVATPAPAGDGPRLLVGGNLRVALGPGITEPVDVKLGNPFADPLDVTAITLEITDINAPNASTAFPCDLRDFQVFASSGAPVRLPAMTVRSLEEIGIPRPQWPSIAMLNRPVNQNGCKGAAVVFRYRAEARSLDP
jgi:hypothetical protein